jgi:hypothetical protein
MAKRSWAAAVLTAVALILVPVYPAGAEVRVKGLPEWLVPVAEKTLSAVWAEIESSDPALDRGATLKIVVPRLLEGYGISSLEVTGNNVDISFLSEQKIDWKVELSPPGLDPVPQKWFSEDIKGLEGILLSIVEDLPLSALGWADHALRMTIQAKVEEQLSGWEPYIVIRVNGTQALLEVKFTPRPPLILALEPVIDSGSIPIILQNRLKESILTGQSGLIGLPVEWARIHKPHIEAAIQAFLLEKNTVERADAKVNVDLDPDQISQLHATIESARYSFYAWFAAYVGTDDRYGELGVHLGRRAQLFPWWSAELYAELITQLNDLDMESRWGMMWSPADRFWIGAEYSADEDQLWYRMAFQGGYNKPYINWRYSENSEHDWGIGWKINQFFSIELHYDDRDEDSMSLKVINNL